MGAAGRPPGLKGWSERWMSIPTLSLPRDQSQVWCPGPWGDDELRRKQFSCPRTQQPAALSQELLLPKERPVYQVAGLSAWGTGGWRLGGQLCRGTGGLLGGPQSRQGPVLERHPLGMVTRKTEPGPGSSTGAGEKVTRRWVQRVCAKHSGIQIACTILQTIDCCVGPAASSTGLKPRWLLALEARCAQRRWARQEPPHDCLYLNLSSFRKERAIAVWTPSPPGTYSYLLQL